MRFFSQSFLYDDPWPIVSLAFFLRYPNPYAAHVLSCDVISRNLTPEGTLRTRRLILKRGAFPKWFPRGIVSRAESWVVEESEVDPFGRVVNCTTRNLDHVKVMQVVESTELRELSDGNTMQSTQARIVSGLGWGLTKRIENHGLNKFKANIQRSREGVSLVLRLLRESRLQPLALGSDGTFVSHTMAPDIDSRPRTWTQVEGKSHQNEVHAPAQSRSVSSTFSRLKSWIRWG